MYFYLMLFTGNFSWNGLLFKLSSGTAYLLWNSAPLYIYGYLLTALRRLSGIVVFLSLDPPTISFLPLSPFHSIFYLDSASLCAPTRWSLKEKFQQSLSELHRSVPGYKDKIDSRVNTIFTNLPDQKIFERYNWSIFDSPELFQPVGNKSLVEIKNTQPDKLFIRVERQTIRRLDY